MSHRTELILTGVGIVFLIGMFLDQGASYISAHEYGENEQENAQRVSRLELSLSGAGDILGDMKNSLESIEATEEAIAAQAERLVTLESEFSAELVRRRAEAMDIATELIEEERRAKAESAQHFIEERLASRDGDNAIVLQSMEARFGPGLLALGIEGERYERILIELAGLQIENDDNLAAYKAGLRSGSEMDAMQARNNVYTALQSLLSEEEYADFRLQGRQSNEQVAENLVYAQMLQTTPTMSIRSREMLAATYSRVRQASPPEDYLQELAGRSELQRKYSYLVNEALPALAAMYEETLEGKELEEAMRFIRENEIRNLRNLRLIQAGIMNDE